MPPRIPQLRCTSTRQFSTIPSRRAIGPESPKWIEIPKPVQPNPPPRKPLKGILPVPRDPFRRDNRYAYKASEEYLDAVTKAPTKSNDKITGPEAERLDWKARMAESRRRNLREGMIGLAKRKVQREEVSAERQKKSQAAREARLNAPMREDERLTLPSIPPEIRTLMNSRGAPTTSRSPAQLAKARVIFAEKQAAKAEQRQAQLHLLHTHATQFIVDEKALDEAIEKEFGTDEHPRSFGNEGGRSVWDEDSPMSVRDVIQGNEGGDGLVRRRLLRLSEEITGGKGGDVEGGEEKRLYG